MAEIARILSSALVVKELLEQALLPYNLPLTILVGLVMLYWLSCIIGVIGVDSFDIDLDAEVDLDADVDSNHIPTPLASLLRFVNATDVPLMAVLSFLAVFMWVECMMANYYFNPEHKQGLALVFFFASFFVSVVIVKIITTPMVPIFKKLKELEKPEPILGHLGEVISKSVDSKFGQVEVRREAGAPAKLSCYTDEDVPLQRGTQVAVIEYDKARGLYRVGRLK